MIIWIEARSLEQAHSLPNNFDEWKAFKDCYQFIKTWCENAGEGLAMHTVDFLNKYKTGGINKASVSRLSPPPVEESPPPPELDSLAAAGW